MTAFSKTNLTFDGEYLMYDMGTGVRSLFVARFKRKGDAPSFIAFLIKNFTVEEYFDRMNNNEAPLIIVRDKGYLQPHIKKWLKQYGYPVTPAGFDSMIADRVAHTKVKTV